jgi:hypothetical protein
MHMRFQVTVRELTEHRGLTYTLRSLLGIAPRRPRYHIRVGLFYAFLLWTGAHISTGRLGIDIRWPAREFAPMAYLDGE